MKSHAGPLHLVLALLLALSPAQGADARFCDRADAAAGGAAAPAHAMHDRQASASAGERGAAAQAATAVKTNCCYDKGCDLRCTGCVHAASVLSAAAFLPSWLHDVYAQQEGLSVFAFFPEPTSPPPRHA